MGRRMFKWPLLPHCVARRLKEPDDFCICRVLCCACEEIQPLFVALAIPWARSEQGDGRHVPFSDKIPLCLHSAANV